MSERYEFGEVTSTFGAVAFLENGKTMLPERILDKLNRNAELEQHLHDVLEVFKALHDPSHSRAFCDFCMKTMDTRLNPLLLSVIKNNAEEALAKKESAK